MILYLDASALAKLFLDEPGADAVRGATSEADGRFTHLIAYAEIRAAFARAVRVGREPPDLHILHKRELAALWPRFNVVLPDEAAIRRAGDLAERFGLRGYDSVHLAAAEAVWSQMPDPATFRFAAFDRALLRAATDLGIEVLEA